MPSFRHDNVAAPLNQCCTTTAPIRLAAGCEHPSISLASKSELIGKIIAKSDQREVPTTVSLALPACLAAR